MPMAQVGDKIEGINNPRLFVLAAEGSKNEKAGVGNIKSSIPRHKCRGYAKTLTLWTDTN